MSKVILDIDEVLIADAISTALTAKPSQWDESAFVKAVRAAINVPDLATAIGVEYQIDADKIKAAAEEGVLDGVRQGMEAATKAQFRKMPAADKRDLVQRVARELPAWKASA